MSTNEVLTNSYDIVYEFFIDLYILTSILHVCISCFIRLPELTSARAKRSLKVSVLTVAVSIACELMIKLLDYYKLTSIVFDRMSECLFVLVITLYNATLHWDIQTLVNSDYDLVAVPKLEP
mmetsp:Transcript_18476/g.33274  ORF Transcript_18476/g.33274 Transcript_18476/m.33274 type:complete len:122 (-) Transcript_18476:1303-1668(-)